MPACINRIALGSGTAGTSNVFFFQGDGGAPYLDPGYEVDLLHMKTLKDENTSSKCPERPAINVALNLAE